MFFKMDEALLDQQRRGATKFHMMHKTADEESLETSSAFCCSGRLLNITSVDNLRQSFPRNTALVR